MNTYFSKTLFIAFTILSIDQIEIQCCIMLNNISFFIHSSLWINFLGFLRGFARIRISKRNKKNKYKRLSDIIIKMSFISEYN